jgi:hypothetical protein
MDRVAGVSRKTDAMRAAGEDTGSRPGRTIAVIPTIEPSPTIDPSSTSDGGATVDACAQAVA